MQIYLGISVDSYFQKMGDCMLKEQIYSVQHIYLV